MLGRFNHWFDRRAEGYKRVIAWALDHRVSMVALAIASFVGALALPAIGLVGGALVPEMDDSSSSSISRRRPGRTSPTRGPRRRRSRASPGSDRRSLTPTRACRRQGDAVDEGTVFVKLTPKAERSRSQARGRHRHPARAAEPGRRQRVDQRRLQPRREADPAAAARAGCARADAAGGGRGRGGAGRSPARSTWPCRRRARSRSWTCRSIAAWPARSA